MLGSPGEEETAWVKNHRARQFLRGLPARAKVAWDRLYPRYGFSAKCSLDPHAKDISCEINVAAYLIEINTSMY